jgi:hypothetical protein
MDLIILMKAPSESSSYSKSFDKVTVFVSGKLNCREVSLLDLSQQVKKNPTMSIKRK